MEIVLLMLGLMRRLLQRIGPYLLVEILLPGGTLLALVLFLCRSGRLASAHPARSAVRAAPAVVRVFGMPRIARA